MSDTLGSAFSEATSSIPGYGVVQQVLLQNFGVEANDLVYKYLILFAVYKFIAWFYDKAHNYLETHFTSSVEIDDYDALFQQLKDWARTQPMTKISREIKAVSTTSRTIHDPDYDEDSDDEYDIPGNDDSDEYAIGPTGLFSFEAWNRKNPLKYYPNATKDFFKYKGRWFQYKTSERRNVYGEGVDELIIIRCLGRSTKPLKQFLEFVKGWTNEKQKVKPTHVYRTSSRGGGGGGSSYWTRVAVRPSRPLSTVALDDTQKKMIVRDINEYLHPATARWYSARGIPHRRGYLFHGPPGTGKTSLSFSLAGLFGLSIYCVALSERGLTETTLGNLFADLPERCIVLLEDIDSAGLRREGGDPKEDAGQQEDSDSTDSDESSATSRSAALLAHLRSSKDVSAQVNKPQSLISLAGLLNVLDGAASQEGRVLIMTTNYPEKLDPALIRPGRVDLQIGFTLATKLQARDIFKRMYNAELDAKKEKSNGNKSSTSTTSSASTDTPAVSSEERAFLQLCLSTPPTSTTIPPAQLEELADKFASSIPTEVLSPAEIQGYLLKKKTDPLSAVSEVDKWRDEHLEEKKQEKKDGEAEAKVEEKTTEKKSWKIWKKK